jgi:hypothetical protein
MSYTTGMTEVAYQLLTTDAASVRLSGMLGFKLLLVPRVDEFQI